jgi:meso-butanediol dehydrogenase/(S,S)-butanediol dehydrogenase/diacetyl reductase
VSCIVTGAARGIGRAIGEALLDARVRRSVSPISMADKVAEVADANRPRRGAGGKVTSCLGVDVTDRMQVREMIAHDRPSSASWTSSSTMPA